MAASTDSFMAIWHGQGTMIIWWVSRCVQMNNFYGITYTGYMSKHKRVDNVVEIANMLEIAGRVLCFICINDWPFWLPHVIKITWSIPLVRDLQSIVRVCGWLYFPFPEQRAFRSLCRSILILSHTMEGHLSVAEIIMRYSSLSCISLNMGY